MDLLSQFIKNKGSVADVNNYRGITILSCLDRLFTSVQNNRLNEYLDSMNIIGEEQSGFRKGYSTLDHIFVFKSLIDIYLSKGKKLYCTLIDYSSF